MLGPIPKGLAMSGTKYTHFYGKESMETPFITFQRISGLKQYSLKGLLVEKYKINPTEA